MLSALPFYITAIFIVTVVLTLLLLLNALHKRSTVGIILIAWLALNAALALNGFTRRQAVFHHIFAGGGACLNYHYFIAQHKAGQPVAAISEPEKPYVNERSKNSC